MKDKKYRNSIIKISVIIVVAIVISYFLFTWNRVVAL